MGCRPMSCIKCTGYFRMVARCLVVDLEKFLASFFWLFKDTSA